MHIQHHPIPPIPTDRRRDHHKLAIGDEIPYAALLARRLVALVRLDVEFQGRDEREQEGEEQLHREGEYHDCCRGLSCSM
jgi:hypothetical protein